MSENGKIMLTADDGSEEAFFVVEKADIAGGSYLVADSLEEDADAMILKETEEDGAVVYETVEDEDELRIISKYFEELLEEEVELRFE